MFGFTTNTIKDNASEKAVSAVQAPVLTAGAEARDPMTTKKNNDSEGTVVVDIPTTTPAHDDDSNNLILLGSDDPDFDNLQEVQTAVDPLDTSLHTTCSDVSIDLDMFLASAAASATKKMHGNNDNEDIKAGTENNILSFHVSQMDSSDLKEESLGLTMKNPEDETKTSNNEDINTNNQESTTDQAALDLDIMVQISQSLLKAEQEKENIKEQAKNSSLLVRFKIWVLLALVLGATARGINNWMFASSPANIAPIEHAMTTKIVIHEDETKLMVGEYTFYKETLDSKVEWNYGSWTMVLLFGMVAKVALSGKTSANNDENSSECIQTDANSEQDNVSEAGSDASSVNPDQQDDDSSDTSTNGVPTLIPIKLEEDDSIVSSYDLSQYEMLKVVELRSLLRSRQCSYAGRKHHLVHRLASIYRAELQSLTVVQLRKKLKSRNMKQGGLKREMVQHLVEAGL